jgi:hypothetical protein
LYRGIRLAEGFKRSPQTPEKLGRFDRLLAGALQFDKL